MDRFVKVTYPQGLRFPESDDSDEESNPEEHPTPEEYPTPGELPVPGGLLEQGESPGPRDDLEEDESLLGAVGGAPRYAVPQDRSANLGPGVRYVRSGNSENPHHDEEEENPEVSLLLPVVVRQPTPGNRGGFVNPNVFLHRLLDEPSDTSSEFESNISRRCVCMLGTVAGAAYGGAACGGLCYWLGSAIGTSAVSYTMSSFWGVLGTVFGAIIGSSGAVYQYDQSRREVEEEAHRREEEEQRREEEDRRRDEEEEAERRARTRPFTAEDLENRDKLRRSLGAQHMERLIKYEKEYRQVKDSGVRLKSGLRENGWSEKAIDRHPSVRSIYSKEMELLECILGCKEDLTNLLGAEIHEQRQQLTRILEELGIEVFQSRIPRVFLVQAHRLLQDYEEEYPDQPSDDEDDIEEACEITRFGGSFGGKHSSLLYSELYGVVGGDNETDHDMSWFGSEGLFETENSLASISYIDESDETDNESSSEDGYDMNWFGSEGLFEEKKGGYKDKVDDSGETDNSTCKVSFQGHPKSYTLTSDRADNTRHKKQEDGEHSEHCQQDQIVSEEDDNKWEETLVVTVIGDPEPPGNHATPPCLFQHNNGITHQGATQNNESSSEEEVLEGSNENNTDTNNSGGNEGNSTTSATTLRGRGTESSSKIDKKNVSEVQRQQQYLARLQKLQQRKYILIPNGYNQAAQQGSLKALREALHGSTRSAQSAMQTLALQVGSTYVTPEKSVRVFASTDAGTSGKKQKAASAQVGTILCISSIPKLLCGAAYAYTKEYLGDIHGIDSPMAIGFVKPKQEINQVSAVIAWNTMFPGFMGFAEYSIGWGQSKNKRFFTHADEVTQAKGTTMMYTHGGVIRLGYNISIPHLFDRLEHIMLTPYIELNAISAHWTPYKEEGKILPSSISGTKETVIEHCIGLKNRWDITDTYRLQVWGSTILGSYENGRGLSATLVSSYSGVKSSIGKEKRIYTQVDLGSSLHIKMTQDLGVGVNVSLRINNMKNILGSHNLGIHCWYDF